MIRIKNLFAVLAFSVIALALPSVASAQWRDRDRNDDWGRNNGGYNRNINSTVRNLKNRSKSFERVLDRELDRSRYDDRRREDGLNDLAEQFRRATDDLEDSYDNGRNNNRSEDDARRVVQLANQIDRALRNARLGGNVQGDWNNIMGDVNVVANAYGINTRNNRNNRNNRNGNNRNNGSWRDIFPF